MQHETHSHGINMSALGRDKQSLSLAQETVAIEVPGLSLYYGDKQALYDVSMNIPKQRVTAFIGPSGCGKSTLLRTFNRMNDLVDGCRVEGAINLYGTNIYRKGEDVAELRRRLIYELKSKFTIVIVTHNMQQAARVSDYTAFMYMGKLVEFGDTDTLFTNPAKKQTEDYITGRYG
eukprot:gene1817-2089_t